MIRQWLDAAMEAAKYEIIEDEEPYYGEIPGVPGVWATGRTLEECRRNLAEALDDWLLFSLANGHPIPDVGGVEVRTPQRGVA